MRIGLLLPAYNEEKNLRKILPKLKKMYGNALILVVDDGSKDKTAEIAKTFGVRVIRHRINKGKGEALKTGFEFFKKTNVEVVVIVDADGQYPVEETKKLLEKIENDYDVVLGYRNWKEVPLRHRIGNFVWRNVFNFLFGTHFKDTNCGLMAITRKALNKIENTGGGYIIENALLVEFLKKRFKIGETQVRVIYKRKSGILRGLRIVLGILIYIVKEGLKFRFSKR